MKPNLILHIGTYKTGSTAIQSYMRHNDEVLSNNGFLYPTFPGDRQSHTFLRAATAKALKSNAQDDLTGCIAAIAEQINRFTPKSVILSSEHFWPASPQLVKLMVSSLEHLFSTVDVVIYLRSQRDLWMSLYSQFAKGMRVLPSHSTWGTPEYCGKGIVEHGMHYANVLDGYHNASERLSVKARVYDRSLFPNRDVVSDFATACGISTDMLAKPSDDDANESLAWKAVEFSKALATYYYSDTPRRKKVAGVMRQSFSNANKLGYGEWIGKSPNYLTESQQDAIYHHYEVDNGRLSRDYFDSTNIFPKRDYLSVCPYSVEDIPSNEKKAVADFLMSRIGDDDLKVALRHLNAIQ
jgi:hypothetical protein